MRYVFIVVVFLVFAAYGNADNTPTPGDLLMSSRWLRPYTSNDPNSTIKTLNEVKPDWLVWSYGETDVNSGANWHTFLDELPASQSLVVQGALRNSATIGAADFYKEACLSYKSDGAKLEPIFIPWLESVGRAFVDINSPIVLNRMIGEALESIVNQQYRNQNIYTFHIDNSAFIAGISGGCFGSYSIDGFKSFLHDERYTSGADIFDVLSELAGGSFKNFDSRESLKKFDYSKYLKSIDDMRPKENSIPSTHAWNEFHKWKTNSALHRKYIEYQRLSVVKFYDNFRRSLLKEIHLNGLPILNLAISGNIHGYLHSNDSNPKWLVEKLDFIQSEVYENDQSVLDSLIKASLASGKYLSVSLVPEATLNEDREWSINDLQMRNNSRTIATVYSHGGGVIFPWDSYMGVGQKGGLNPRYFAHYKDWPIYDLALEFKELIANKKFICSSLYLPIGRCENYVDHKKVNVTVWENQTDGCYALSVVHHDYEGNLFDKIAPIERLGPGAVINELDVEGNISFSLGNGEPRSFSIAESAVWTLIEHCDQSVNLK